MEEQQIGLSKTSLDGLSQDLIPKNGSFPEDPISYSRLMLQGPNTTHQSREHQLCHMLGRTRRLVTASFLESCLT